jgi:probable rRNA maturation factor
LILANKPANISVNVYSINQQSALQISQRAVQRLAKHVIGLEGREYDEVAINFVDVPAICKLHEQYFNDPTPTDCISFPMDDLDELGYRVMGEIFVCPEVAIKYAESKHADPYDEISLYVVHGLLHLMGYDDIKIKDRKEMRKAEERHMSSLKEHKLCLRKYTERVSKVGIKQN